MAQYRGNPYQPILRFYFTCQVISVRHQHAMDAAPYERKLDLRFFELVGAVPKAGYWALCTTGGFSRQRARWLRMTVLFELAQNGAFFENRLLTTDN